MSFAIMKTFHLHYVGLCWLSLFTTLGLTMSAQSFTLPYNPDENGDMLIGVVDLQALLANYGQEFSGAVLSEDEESAITYMGDMAYPLCAQACRNLPGMWEMPFIEDLGLIWDEVVPNSVPYSNASSTWLKPMPNSPSMPETNYFVVSRYEYFESGAHQSASNLTSDRRCYCAAKQLPRVEYTYCEGTDIQECANEKVETGWYALEGITKISFNGQNKIQAFWRWAE